MIRVIVACQEWIWVIKKLTASALIVIGDSAGRSAAAARDAAPVLAASDLARLPGSSRLSHCAPLTFSETMLPLPFVGKITKELLGNVCGTACIQKKYHLLFGNFFQFLIQRDSFRTKQDVSPTSNESQCKQTTINKYLTYLVGTQ